MIKYSKYIVGVIFLIQINCMSQKKEINQNNQLLNKLIVERVFRIEFQWAYPMITSAYSKVVNSGLLPPGNSPGHVNIVGNSNYFRMQNDSVSAYLPYFGERQMGGSYGSNNGGIQFEGVPEKLEITVNKKGGYNIKFSINDKENITENYNVYIEITTKLNANLNINSNQRLNIKYKGKVKGQ